MRTAWRTLTAAFGAALAIGLGIAACNGTGYDRATTPPVSAATGIWEGTDSLSGLNVTGFVDSANNAVFIRSDGVSFVGPTQLSSDTFIAAVIGYTSFPATFADGSNYGLGTLNGTVASGSTLTLTLSFTTNGGSVEGGSWSLTYNALSSSGSSLATLSANYTDATSGSVISITGNGVMTGQNPANSCVLNGTATIINSTYDIYQVTLTYESCTGSYAVLNGVQLTGLAVLNPDTAPSQLTIEVAGASTTGKFALVLNLTGS